MPINSTHPEFDISKSAVCNDAYSGDVLDYVPQLTKQNNEEYEAYRNRGVYFNVTKKTVEAAVGAILRKPFDTDAEDVQIDENLQLDEFVSQILRSVVLEGRCGLLCDYSEDKGEPQLVMYERSNIVNWRKDGSLVVIKEIVYEEDPKDIYELQEIEQYRELYLDDDGMYAVRIWRQDGLGGKSTFKTYMEMIPTMKGERLAYIPFTFVNPFDTTDKSVDPVVINMAQLNISHFRSTVDLEHGVHFTALPQPVVMGDFVEDLGTEVAIGSDFVWQLTEGSDAKYLEFQGTGLSSIVERLTHKEEQMAFLGGQLFVMKKGIESADALRLRGAANSATLVNIVNAVESGMQQILTIRNQWMGNSNEAEFVMNRDFTSAVLSPQEMQSLMQLYLNGTISQETYLENLYEGEITRDVAEEMIRLSKESTNVEESE